MLLILRDPLPQEGVADSGQIVHMQVPSAREQGFFIQHHALAQGEIGLACSDVPVDVFIRKGDAQVVGERAVVPGAVVLLDLPGVDVANRAIYNLLTNDLRIISAGRALSFSCRYPARHGADRRQLSLWVEAFLRRVLLAYQTNSGARFRVG